MRLYLNKQICLVDVPDGDYKWSDLRKSATWELKGVVFGNYMPESYEDRAFVDDILHEMGYVRQHKAGSRSFHVFKNGVQQGSQLFVTAQMREAPTQAFHVALQAFLELRRASAEA